MKIYNCCCLCLKEDESNGDKLIWKDSMQLCEECYTKYSNDEYERKIMPINAIKSYRGKIEQLNDEKIELEDKLKIAVAMLTKGTYPETNIGDNDFDKQFINVKSIKEIRDKAEVMDYYTLNDVITDLSKLIGDEVDE